MPLATPEIVTLFDVPCIPWFGWKTLTTPEPLIVLNGFALNVLVGNASLANETVPVVWVNSALFKIEPITGKTHQIRAHAKYIKTPLAGDQRYGIQPDEIVTEYGLTRLFLHAESISFPGLSLNESNFSFKSELDPKLTKVLERLRSNNH